MNNNPITEVGMLVITGLLIIGGVGLLYAHVIDFTAATFMFGSALTLYGVNGAFKAPSPGQQTQLNIQQQNLQTLLSQVLSVLPGLIQSFQPQPIPAQVLTTQPQPQQVAQPLQGVSTPVPTPARGPVANPGGPVNPPPLQGSQQGPLLPAIDLRKEPQPIMFPQRNWNDSQLMPSVQQPGQQQGQ